MPQPKIMTTKTLRLLLGDQLNSNHSWFKEVDSNITYVMMEIRSETDYAQHHIQKVLGFFASMRRFADGLTAAEHQVIYIRINDPENQHEFDKNCQRLIDQYQFKCFEYQLPDELRLDQHLSHFATRGYALLPLYSFQRHIS
jgi:deoxyribodipyrimidine photolyase-related protein